MVEETWAELETGEVEDTPTELEAAELWEWVELEPALETVEVDQVDEADETDEADEDEADEDEAGLEL